MLLVCAGVFSSCYVRTKNESNGRPISKISVYGSQGLPELKISYMFKIPTSPLLKKKLGLLSF